VQSVAIVTGASQGIGRGCALALAKAGWIVYVTARNPERLTAAVKSINDTTGKQTCIGHVCDHGNDAQVRETFDKIFKAHPKIDVLVNNAYSGVDDISGAMFKAPQPFYEKDFAKLWDASHIWIEVSFHCYSNCC